MNALIALCLMLAANAPAELPTTPAGRVAAEYVKAVNAGGDSLRKFIDRRFEGSPADLARLREFHEAVRRAFAPLAPATIVQDDARHVSMSAYASNGQLVMVTVSISEGNSRGLISIGVAVQR